MKIVFVNNQARSMCNFWSVLIQELKNAGHDLVCFIPSSGVDENMIWEEQLLSLGVRLRHYPLERKGLNPLKDIKTLFALYRLFRQEQPDLLFSSTIKPVIYASLAAWLAGFPCKARRYAMITGLGYTFEADSLLKKGLRLFVSLLYRLAFYCNQGVFFQNKEDLILFRSLRIIPKDCLVFSCRGTGVDTKKFQPQPLGSGPVSFLFIGRLLKAKGLYELAAAARIIKAAYPEISISLLGPQESGPGSVPLPQIRDWERSGFLTYLGETEDVRSFIASAHVIILPSWREGIPCALLEGMSMGRALIAADAPGSREVVCDGVNGLLVPLKNPEALADAMECFLKDPTLVAKFGAKGRLLAIEEFDAVLVAQSIMAAMGVAGPGVHPEQ